MAIGANDAAAVTAFNRFGFGARPGGLSEAAGDPRGFLLEELWTANVALIRDHAPPSGTQALQAYYLQEEGIREERARMAAAAMQTVALTATPPAGPKATVGGALASPSPSATAAGPSMAPSAPSTMVQPGKPEPAMIEPPKKPAGPAGAVPRRSRGAARQPARGARGPLSSDWSLSGPIISPSPSPRAQSCGWRPVPSSARRSAPTCSASSRRCWSRRNRTRR